MHYQVNTECESAAVLITLSSNDPGTTTVLQSPRKGQNGTVAVVDPLGFEAVRGLVTDEVAAVVDKCYAKCGKA